MFERPLLFGNSGSLTRWPTTATAPEYRTAVNRVLASGLLTEGPEVPHLEAEFAEWLDDDRYVIALNSGTAAISAALLARGVKPGTRALVPDMSFTATALACTNVGIVPYFVAVDDTWSIDVEDVDRILRAGMKVGAIIGVDLHGMPANWSALAEAAAERGIPLIEDACPAYGAEQHGIRCGTFPGVDAAFSLNQSKILPAGEGGLFVTESAERAEFVKALRTFGEPLGLWHRRQSVFAGFNWKLPEMSAAIARAGIPFLRQRITNGQNRSVAVEQALEGGPFAPPLWTDGATPSWHKYRVRITGRADRESLESRLRDLGVMHSPVDVRALSTHPAFRDWIAGAGVPFQRTELQIEQSVVLGTRARPIFAWTNEEEEQVCSGLRQLQEVLV